MVDVRMTMDEYDALRRLILSEEEGRRRRMDFAIAEEAPDEPKKRKVGEYQREYGRRYRKLKSKHPRMTHVSLTKKAHRETKRALKS